MQQQYALIFVINNIRLLGHIHGLSFIVQMCA